VPAPCWRRRAFKLRILSARGRHEMPAQAVAPLRATARIPPLDGLDWRGLDLARIRFDIAVVACASKHACAERDALKYFDDLQSTLDVTLGGTTRLDTVSPAYCAPASWAELYVALSLGMRPHSTLHVCSFGSPAAFRQQHSTMWCRRRATPSTNDAARVSSIRLNVRIASKLN
jgi:hypothetical protein